MSSKDLIQEGMQWRIGNSDLVKIWGDKWLLTPTTYKVQSPLKILTEDAVVRTLVDEETRGWNKALVYSIFAKEEADDISSIPLSKYGNPDMLVSQGSSNGEFTVRSAYYIEIDRKKESKGECSKNESEQNLWKMIWGFGVHVKISSLRRIICRRKVFLLILYVYFVKQKWKRRSTSYGIALWLLMYGGLVEG